MTEKQFIYTGYDNLETMKEAHKYNSFLVSLIVGLDLTQDAELLDIGAGIGLYAEMLRNKGYNISCLEPDLTQAKILQQKGFKVYTSMLEIEKQFDFMYAFNVLEHIENDTKELAVWRTKLKKDCKLLIYVPAFNVLFSNMDKKIGHFRRYTRKELSNKATTTGLKIVKSAQYADSIGFFVALIYKLIGSKGDINTKTLIFYDRFLFPISRICDIFFRKIFGKNVFIIVENKKIEK
jgi:SAM-dependent methyltransferase